MKRRAGALAKPPSAAKAARAKKAPAAAAGNNKPRSTGSAHKGPVRRAPMPIVAIGASAGGLESLTSLLPAIPRETRMAIVIIMHLDPHHPSMLPEILGRVAQVPIVEARQGMRLESGKVYLMPPNTSMLVREATLDVYPRKPRYSPIDDFFRALAADQGSNAFVVVLSGSACDGALGAKAVKMAGGITFAEAEESARFADMPRAAIALGAVDYVLPPREIAVELTRLCDGRPSLAAKEAGARHEAAGADNDESLSRILALLRRTAALDFASYKESTVRRRILRRMSLHRRATLADYAQYLEGNPSEIDALCQDILINVTAFFRDPDTFAALKAKVLPDILQSRAPDEPLRVWVPGCSTGEEAYSLAICLSEFAADSAGDLPIQLFATDVSESSLARAREGSYPEAIANDVSPERLRRFFVKSERGYRISKSIRDMCVFARHNLTRDPPFSKIDLVSCRNVLIYMGPVLQRRVLHVFHYALRPGRFLVLGSSETIGALGELFTLADRRAKIYTKESAPARLNLDAAQPGERDRDRTFAEREPAEKLQLPAPWQLADVVREAERRLLDRFVPACVIVDERLQVLHVRGSTGDYLEAAQGTASLDLLRMAREGLRVDLRTLLHRAAKSQSTARKEGVTFRAGGVRHDVNLEASPLRGPGAGDRFYLVVFERALRPGGAPPPEAPPPKQSKASRAASGEDKSEVGRLRRELAATKEYLQSIIEEVQRANEELRSANEEIQSGNEELQSTNEELETAKEELQSTNEELTTVNEELQNRNAELSKVNNDYANLLSSIHIPIVMLDGDLRIRRFTPMAGKLMNLIATDVGRPISDMKPNFELTDLDRRIHEVIDSLHNQEVDVRDREGHWFVLRIRPYRTSDNKIDGAVLALLEADALHRSAGALAELQAHVRTVAGMVSEPLVVLDRDLRILLANQPFARAFNLMTEEIEGQLLQAIEAGPWNDRELRRRLLEELPTAQAVEFDLASGGERFGVTARLLGEAGEPGSRIILVVSKQPPGAGTA